MASEIYRVGDLTVDVLGRLLVRGGESVTLPPKTFELLVALVRRAPAVVSRQELLDSVWPDELVNDETLTQRVKLLRTALGDDPRKPTYVASVPRWGYRLVAPVEAGEGASNGSPARGGKWRSASPAGRNLSWPGAVGAVVVVVALALAAMVAHQRRTGRPAAPPGSLAVLPFTFGAGLEPPAYIRYGLAEGVTNRLARLDGLRVTAWSTMLHFQGAAASPRAVARELDVAAVLVGQVNKEGTAVRVMVELVDGRDGSQRWGDGYLAPRDALLSLQRQITEGVARALRPGITAAELSRLGPPRTASTEAFESYLKGRYCWNRREPAMVARAIRFFRSAVALDPSFAAAHAGLADCYVVLGGAPYGAMPPVQAARLADEAAQAAVAADPSLAEGYATLALLAWSHELEWERAATLFATSLRLDPGYATAHQWYAEYLAALGELGAAEREVQSALALDPLSPAIGVDAGMVAYYRRRFAEAVARFERVLAVDPGFPQARLGLGLALTQAGRRDEAIAVLDRLVQSSERSPSALAALGYAYGRAGRLEPARAIYDELRKAAGERYVPAYYLGAVCLGMGDRDRAFTWLMKAADEPSSLVASLNVEPGVDPLRHDPKFRELLRRLHLQGAE